MTEEPYRWLEAVQNRREYVREQLKGALPAFALSLEEGILLLSIGNGSSKVFEVFDRHALAGLGHPADIERIRQAVIDSAHMEAFTRAPEDVSLRRLVSYGLSPQLKQNFEQIFSAPYLVELILAEVAPEPAGDALVRLRFDGGFQLFGPGLVVAASSEESEVKAGNWLKPFLSAKSGVREAADLMLQAAWCLAEQLDWAPDDAGIEARRSGWKKMIEGKQVEIGFLKRSGARAARYEPRTLESLGL